MHQHDRKGGELIVLNTIFMENTVICHLQLANVGIFDRYEIRVSKAAIVASFPHSMTCVIEVVVTTPITPGPRRIGIHSM